MDTKHFDSGTVKAAEASIEKHINILYHGANDRGTSDCAFCLLYHGDKCKKCPIYLMTGYYQCVGSPYHDFYTHYLETHKEYLGKNSYVACPVCRDFVEEEVLFLKKVLTWIKEEIKANKESEREKTEPDPTPPKLFLKVLQPNTSIGKDRIDIAVVNSLGHKIPGGLLFSINQDGSAYRYTSVKAGVGLLLDERERIVLKDPL